MSRLSLLLVVLFLLSSCGGDSASVCDICGEQGGKHRVFQKAPAVIAKIAKLEGGERLVRQLRSMGVAEAKLVCPRVFGDLPAPGTLRILAPRSVEHGSDRQVWSWIIVSAQPVGGTMAKGLGVTLRCGEPSAVGVSRDHVWLITLEVDRQMREFGPIAHASLTNQSGTGGTTTSVGMGANIPAAATLDRLVVVNRGEVLAAVPTRVLLATVDGNPVTLDLVTGERSTEPEPRRGWEDWFTERIYSGHQPSDRFDKEWQGQPAKAVQVVSDEQAKSRAVAYLSHHGVGDWGQPVRVTRTALNHYRVEFAPTAAGRNRALIVDPKNGFVDHPRHPR